MGSTKIKAFNLKYSEELHGQLVRAAQEKGETMQDFIVTAIEERVRKVLRLPKD